MTFIFFITCTQENTYLHSTSNLDSSFIFIASNNRIFINDGSILLMLMIALLLIPLRCMYKVSSNFILFSSFLECPISHLRKRLPNLSTYFCWTWGGSIDPEILWVSRTCLNAIRWLRLKRDENRKWSHSRPPEVTVAKRKSRCLQMSVP